MIKKTLENALNNQVKEEMFSAYLYLSMAMYFESLALKGMANWMKVQYQEEMFHATKLYNYINERGGRVIFEQIEKPQSEWSSILDVFEASYQHEQKITGLINDLVDLAIAEKDHATNAFLQWYVTEQVEEEASVDEIVQKLKLIGDSKNALFMLDKELGARVFTPPVTD